MRFYTRASAGDGWTERTVEVDSVVVTDEVNARSLARAVVLDPSGALLFGRGQGVRVTRKTGDEYWLDLPGTDGNYASTPNATSLDLSTGDLDVRVKLSRPDWDDSGTIMARSSTNALTSWILRTSTWGDGSLQLTIRTANGFASVEPEAEHGVANGDAAWFRVTRTQADGVTTFYTSSDGASWTQFGSSKVADAGAALLSAGDINVGARFDGLEHINGTVYRAQVYDGIDGTLVADFNPDDGEGALSWDAATTGETWTVNQSGSPAATIESEELSEDVFRGFIMQASESRLGVAGERRHEIDAVDLHYLVDKRIVADAYQDMTAGAIVTDLIATHLDGEGITEGLIQAGPTVKAITFDYVTVSDAISDLAERAGFWWRVNPDATLDFAEPVALTTLYAGTEGQLSGTTSILAGATGTGAGAATDLEGLALVDTISVNRHANGYRNRQWIRGGQAQTVTQVETQYGDGERRAFAVGFPIAGEPTIEVSRNGGPWVAQTLGVAGLQTGAFTWSRNSVTIQQTATETVLTTVDRVRVTYTGLFDVIAKVDDEPEQTTRAVVEGGTGVVERVLVNRSSDSQNDALQLAGELIDYWTPQATTIRFATRSVTFAPGQTGVFSIPEAGIDSATALVTTVEHYTSGLEERQVVTMVIGPQEGSWASWFGFLSRRIDRIAERAGGEVEVVTTQESFSKTWTEAERPNIFVETYPSASTVPGATVIPMFDIDERVLYLAWFFEDAELGRKQFTTQAGADSDEITTTTILVTTDAVGAIDELAWFGGHEASSAPGSGVEVDRQAFVTTKTDIEQIQVVKTDTKWS